MPLVMVTKTQREKNCSAQLVKFLDRIDIRPDGSAEGVLEFIIAVGEESEQSLSTIIFIIPNRLKEDSVRDVTETLKDPNLHFNKSYSYPVRRIGREEDRLFEVDGITCSAGKNSTTIANPLDNDDRLCIFPIDFEPIQRADKRVFRISYEMPNFAELFSSIGFFQYIFNNVIYEAKLTPRLEVFVPVAIGIDRTLCEMMIYLPEGYIFSYGNPDPQKVIHGARCKLLSNECYSDMKSGIYYDLEDFPVLPGRRIGQILFPKPDQEIVLYCQFQRPTVALEEFGAKISEINSAIDESAGKISKYTAKAESSLNSLSQAFEERLRKIIRQSWIAFAITVAISLFAVGLAIFQIYSFSKNSEKSHEGSKKMETPLTRPDPEKKR
ncbi:MAG: hypothetical protein ACETV1_07870 [Candidatus Bathyarchaeia archaeon]